MSSNSDLPEELPGSATHWEKLFDAPGAPLPTAAPVPSYIIEVPDSDVPPCTTIGKGYNDPMMNKTLNGAYTHSPAICYELCKNTVYCEYFTWYADGGGCWLQGINAELTINSSHAYAGSVKCYMTTSDSPNATDNVTDEALVVLPDTQVAAQDISTHTDSGFPLYGWVSIISALITVAGLVFCCLHGGNKRASKKRATRSAKLSTVEELEEGSDDDEMKPLMSTEVQLKAKMAPQHVYAAPAARIAVPSVAVPAPVMTYSVASPVAYSAPAAAPAYSAPVAASVSTMTGTYLMAAAAAGPANVYAHDSLFCRICGRKRDMGSGT